MDTHINPILKPLMRDMTRKRPENVCDFITNWIKESGKLIEEKRVARASKIDADHLPPSEDSFIVEPEEEEDEFDIKAIKTKQRQTKKKFAISAEAYGEYNKLENFKPRVIEKTEEQKTQIKEILSKNFMFSSLDVADQDIVIGAMEIRTYQKDDQVIKQGDEGNELFIVSTGLLTCNKVFEEN